MLNFSMSSVLMASLLGNLFILCLALVFHNRTRMLQIGFPLLTLFCTLAILRMCFPFELLPITTNIYFPKYISIALTSILHPYWEWTLFGNFILEGSIWTLLEIFWFLGIFYRLYQCFQRKYNLYQYFHCNNTEVTEEAPYKDSLASLELPPKLRKKLHIYIVKGLTSPMICKFWHYYILLPEDLILSKQELFFVLRHETAHALHHDLTTKFLVYLLCSFYWWNPACNLLRKQVEILQESKADLAVTSGDPKTTLAYLQLLVKIMEKYKQQPPMFKHGISFSGIEDSLLVQRFQLMTKNNEIKTKACWKLALLPICILYLFSLFYIFEPGYIPVEKNGIIASVPENTFLIRDKNGDYHVYCNNHLLGTEDSLEHFKDNYKIYDSLEDAEKEWGTIQ